MTAVSLTGRSLDEWLAYLESIHPTEIELGLERVGKVASVLGLTEFADSKVITVAGTNGKGSTCAYIEQCLLAAGYSVGVYSSPHISDYRERVRVNSELLEASQHCLAFAAVEAARLDISLSYFEFGTLAALWLLKQHSPDVVLLEVGLGGRLDATNVVEPDVAVVTTVDIDHQAFLGDNKDQIGFEKAGIFRPNKPAILGDYDLPGSVRSHAESIKAIPKQAGMDFCLQPQTDGRWYYDGLSVSISDIATPQLPLANVATAIAAIEATQLNCPESAIRQGIRHAALAGRWQQLQAQPVVIADVAHNPQSTRLLAERIKSSNLNHGRVIAVAAMLADKDSVNSLAPMLAVVQQWHLASLDVPRGASANKLAEAFDSHVELHSTVAQALRCALESAGQDDMVVVFGSFYTVAEAQQWLQGSSGE